MYQLIVENHFSAAHFLREYKGKCENLHGHNWKVEVVFEADALNATGMVLDFIDAKKFLRECLEELDHTNINEIAKFKVINPTTENIAQHIFETLQDRVPDGVRISKVTSWETPGSGAVYTPD
jgi:6-pyruvoyltetrahydropterin/6-carboxytetrahydropterin synthase